MKLFDQQLKSKNKGRRF